MKISKISVWQVDLPLHEGDYKWSGGKSVETFDTFILLSGDSDFVGLIQSLDAKNKVVKVVSSSKKNQLQN